MHPAFLVFLQKLNTCESPAVKWHPIKNVCSKISAQSMFLSFLHFFCVVHKQNQFIGQRFQKAQMHEHVQMRKIAAMCDHLES